ncbi:uncharacterized protein LOC133183648 [Saccostrea echinata]|uniref:uncharacterized protein LOC133183648 n=1 Tax=Saccostrea echinata TaxID=191078 RepID=UPI002A7F8646|nr:uncharacterized protein LOC133183648 [Saccostrea echinata]
MSFTAENCSDVRWRGNAVVEFTGTNLTSLHVSSANVNLTHSGLSAFAGPVHAELVGDCCTSSVILSAVDADGFVSQCRFLLYPEFWVATNIVKDTSEPLKFVETSINVAILGGVFGALAGLIIAIGVMVKICHSSDRKTAPMKDKTNPNMAFSTENQNVYFHCTPPADSRYICTTAKANLTKEYSKT